MCHCIFHQKLICVTQTWETQTNNESDSLYTCRIQSIYFPHQCAPLPIDSFSSNSESFLDWLECWHPCSRDSPIQGRFYCALFVLAITASTQILLYREQVMSLLLAGVHLSPHLSLPSSSAEPMELCVKHCWGSLTLQLISKLVILGYILMTLFVSIRENNNMLCP